MELSHNPRVPLLVALVLGLALGTAGCNGGGEQAGKAADKTISESKQGMEKVIATVNGEPVTEEELLAYRSTRKGSPLFQDRQAMLDELITQKVVYQDALRQKLDEEPEVLKELEQLRKRVILSAAIRQAMKEAQISEEEMRAEYERLKGEMASVEYKAGHILVDEEQQARQLIGQLKEGADFAELARQYSSDASGKNGGDLGWFKAEQMVEPFSRALAKLQKGSYTAEPVKTQFGWHVIKLEDKRQVEAPGFEQLKGRIEKLLRQNKVRDYFESLKSKAEITIQEAESVVGNAMEEGMPAGEAATDSEAKQ
jgi:peptidyl-prolyl cis-trans isomerase C